jgi:hypothetical protein
MWFLIFYIPTMLNCCQRLGLAAVLVFYNVLPAPQPIEKLMMKVTTKADRITSAGY